MVARIANVPMMYVVVVVDKDSNVEIFKTTKHREMMAKVRQVAADQKQYTVLRQAI